MKLKQRFKKAIFAFFKDEILNIVEYPGPFKGIEIKNISPKMVELRRDILLSDDYNYRGYDLNKAYNMALEDVKQKLFEDVMEYVKVDSKTVMSSHIYPHRAISVSLIVGKQ